MTYAEPDKESSTSSTLPDDLSSLITKRLSEGPSTSLTTAESASGESGESAGLDLSRMIAECILDSERWFPGDQTLGFLALCLAGEVGEVCNKIKKVARGTDEWQDIRDATAEEVIDVLVYLCNMMGNEAFAGFDWKKLWDKKRNFNESRFGGVWDGTGTWTGFSEKGTER